MARRQKASDDRTDPPHRPRLRPRCTSAVDFSHWTLVMQGPKANYTMFGDLVTAK